MPNIPDVGQSLAQLERQFYINRLGEVTSTQTAKIGTASASGNTDIWTPAAGKKVRLRAYRISAAGNLYGVGGALAVQIKIGSMLIGQDSIFIPSLLGAVLGQLPGVGNMITLPSSGIVGINADDKVTINLSSGVSGGSLVVNLYGSEE